VAITRAAMECLENRRLLSAGASLSAGVVTVTGADDVNDVVALSSSGGTFTAVVDGTTYPFTDPVNSISVSLLSGNDSLSLNGGVPGGSADLGDGDDQMTIAPGNEVANVSITGGNGNDRLMVTDSPLIAIFDGGVDIDSFTYTGGSIGSAIHSKSFELADYAYSGAHHFSNIESLTVNGGGGDDELDVTGEAFPVTVTGGDGNDTIDLGSLWGVTGTMSVQGNAGTDRFKIEDTAAFGSSVNYTLTSSTLARSGSGDIAYSSVEGISLRTQASDANIALTGTDPMVSYYIETDGAASAISLGAGDLTDCASSPLTIWNFGTSATLSLQDQDHSGAEAYSLSANDVSRGSFHVQFGQMTSVTLNAGKGSDTIDLHGTGASTSVIINGGGGHDVLTLSAAASSPVTFNGGLNSDGGDVLNVNAGTYTFAADASTGSTDLSVNVGASGAVIFSASQHLAGLSISGGNATLSQDGNRFISMSALTITGGYLDPTDNDLIVRGGIEGIWNGHQYTGILGMVGYGRQGGSGIRTFPGKRTLGVASAAELGIRSFDGETLTGSEVLVKYTYGGDANLDGKINIDDYGRIDAHVGQSGSVFGWYNGDFNYDGKINIDDYGIIDSVIGAQGPVL
jgi:hypothetical protein